METTAKTFKTVAMVNAELKALGFKGDFKKSTLNKGEYGYINKEYGVKITYFNKEYVVAVCKTDPPKTQPVAEAPAQPVAEAPAQPVAEAKAEAPAEAVAKTYEDLKDTAIYHVLTSAIKVQSQVAKQFMNNKRKAGVSLASSIVKEWKSHIDTHAKEIAYDINLYNLCTSILSKYNAIFNINNERKDVTRDELSALQANFSTYKETIKGKVKTETSDKVRNAYSVLKNTLADTKPAQTDKVEKALVKYMDTVYGIKLSSGTKVVNTLKGLLYKANYNIKGFKEFTTAVNDIILYNNAQEVPTEQTRKEIVEILDIESLKAEFVKSSTIMALDINTLALMCGTKYGKSERDLKKEAQRGK